MPTVPQRPTRVKSTPPAPGTKSRRPREEDDDVEPHPKRVAVPLIGQFDDPPEIEFDDPPPRRRIPYDDDDEPRSKLERFIWRDR